MAKRRSRGDGSVYWSERRQRWIAEVTIGFDGRGKRRTKKRAASTKTRAKEKLKGMQRELDDGIVSSSSSYYRVEECVKDWLQYGLVGRADGTQAQQEGLALKHIVPDLGATKLRELTADDLDRWLENKATELSTRTLETLMSIVRRAIKRAQARDKVVRNVALLVEIPKGQPGRLSKSLTVEQAEEVLSAGAATTWEAYVVVSLLTGARTEEVRALRWSEVDLDGEPAAEPPIPPWMAVWRSVRAGGDTKTKKSRRTLALPTRCVTALREHRERQGRKREQAPLWNNPDLVFTTGIGTELDASNVRRGFRTVLAKTSLNPQNWTPRELRHSFVSILSDANVPTEMIARLVGHSSTQTTETIYRHQIRPVVSDGAKAMDGIFCDEP